MNKLLPSGLRALVEDRRFYPLVLLLLLLATATVSAVVLLRWLDLPIIDMYAFRQTQTALSAYWMLREFSVLAYQTPVLGYPWSVPMEFPVYQLVVVALAKACPALSLDACGRLVSWAFMALTLYPIYRIVMRYFADKTSFLIFATLYLASPIYMFWGRTFMIETCATFFGAMFWWSLIRLGDGPSLGRALGAAALGVLAAMAKVTTAPPFMLLGFLHILHVQRAALFLNWKNLALAAVPAVATLASVICWTHHSDALKEANLIGQRLVSHTLTEWNFGTVEQKLSPATWAMLLPRALRDALGGPLVFLALLPPLFLWARRRIGLAAICLGVFLLPLLVFTNLHVQHRYYLASCALFLVAFAGVVVFGVYQGGRRLLATVLLAVVVGGMFHSLWAYHLPSLERAAPSNASLVLGDIVANLTPERSALVVFGNTYCSDLQYYSRRKGLTMPEWEWKYDEIGARPAAQLGGLPLGAVVAFERENYSPEYAKVVGAFLALLGPARQMRIDHYEIFLPEATAAGFTSQAVPATALTAWRQARLEGPGQPGEIMLRRTGDRPAVEFGFTPSSEGRYALSLAADCPGQELQAFYLLPGDADFGEKHSIYFRASADAPATIVFPRGIAPRLRLALGQAAGPCALRGLSIINLDIAPEAAAGPAAQSAR